jgi:PTH1 family peptidyl-tRNA hydrolase
VPSEQNPIRLIAGLGNPGPKYEQTRHNAGFWFVDEIARRYNAEFRKEAKFHGLACKVTIDGQDVWLLKPDTFMNLSGQAVNALAGFYKIPPASILVVHDELDLPPGTARLKHEGGHGGHNGLRDLIQKLGTREFKRLRIGIGHPGHKDQVHDYVLKNPSKQDKQDMDNAIDDAARLIPEIVAGDFEKAMNDLHR